MLKYFMHPKTNEKLPVNECFEKGLLSEYYPLAYLHACALQRSWYGKPSTTQLINGARQEYLKIFYPYAENPKDSIFKIVSTRSHKKLERLTPKESYAELSMPEASEISGIADLLEQQPSGEWWLTDYKVIGAYSIKKSIGLVKKTRPMKDENGNPVLYKKSSRWGKAGDPRNEDYYEIDDSKKDLGTYPLQLNKYRIEIEKYFDVKISKLKIFAIPRETDKGTIARYGIEARPYYIDVPIIDNDEILDYFERKKTVFLRHVEAYEKADEKENEEGYKEKALFENMPDICNDEESWSGNKCNGYCPVVEACRKKGCHYLIEKSA